MNILIVDDHPEIWESLASDFSHHSFSFANNGVEALAFFDNFTDIDIIFLDKEMPGMGGLEFLRRFKKTTEKIIISSGDYLNKDELRTKGVDGFLDKPFSMSEFFEVIASHAPKKTV